jgi:hypothetical protein
MHIARLSLQSYAWPRFILGQYDYCGKTVVASGDIAAGSPFATTELKVYLLRLARALQVASRPMATLSIFVDDFSISTAQATEEEAAKVITSTYRLAVQGLKELELVVAPDKTELITSSDSLRALIRVVIPTVNLDNSCRKLGVDVNYRKGTVTKRSQPMHRKRFKPR